MFSVRDDFKKLILIVFERDMSLSVINKMYILVTKCTNGPETVTSRAENPEITCVRRGER